jgi:hypothetical protein
MTYPGVVARTGSGPGGRRFKSSLPDQSFQQFIFHFCFFHHIAVDDCVDGSDFAVIQMGFPRDVP